MRDDESLWLLLERYLAGEASAAEAEAVRAWLAADPGHPGILDDLARVRRVGATRPPERTVDEAWARAADALGLHGPARSDREALGAEPSVPVAARSSVPSPRLTLHRRTRLPRARVALAAAGVLIAVLGGVLALVESRSHPTEVAAGAMASWREIVTIAGQRAIVQLTDGTQLTLAPRSRLRYARDFGETSREVHLEGEAYFDVPHDTTRPFLVYTRGAVTEDLGTAFAVTAYPDEATTTVLVASGRVATRRTDDAAGAARRAAPHRVVLDRGDLARLDGAGGVAVTHGVDVERHLAWTTGTLAFDSTPLGDVIRTLERWYDLDVRLTDPALVRRPLTARFHGEPVSQVLDRIALTLDLRVERDGRSVVLRPNNPERPTP